jgi:hypothetical protein
MMAILPSYTCQHELQLSASSRLSHLSAIMTEEKIGIIRRWANDELQIDYVALLHQYGEKLVGDRFLIYSADDVVERNETFETKEYCPGYIAIGDDSGGSAIITNLGVKEGPVFLVGHGSMSLDDFVQLASDLQTWLKHGFPQE